MKWINISGYSCIYSSLKDKTITFCSVVFQVYRMSYPGELKLNLTLRSQWGTEVGLSDRYAVKIQEVNNRTVTISDSGT